MPLRVGIFASVSTPQQAAVDKDSLPSQIRDGTRWASTVDGEVVAVYEVPGHSRKYIFYNEAESNVPAYRQLREDCENRRLDVLWCRARDRLGRTDALIAQVEALVRNSGAQVYSALVPVEISDTSDAAAIYLSAIERAQAEVENVQRVRRAKVGKDARFRRGLPAHRWPHGYRPVRDSKGTVIGGEFDPAEIGAVELVTKLYLDGIGTHNIRHALEASKWKPRRAERWSLSTVQKMVKRDFYAGYVTHGDAQVKSDRFPALWDEETHRAMIRERHRRHRGGSPPSYAVSGLPVCARCGYTMHLTYSDSSRQYQYFRCPKHAYKARYGGSCHSNIVRLEKVVDAVEGTLEALKDVELRAQLLAESLPDLSGLEAERARVQAQIERIQQKRERLVELVVDSRVAADMYRIQDDRLIAELEEAMAALRDVDERLAVMPSREERARALEELAGQEIDLWDQDHAVEMRAALMEAGIRVVCEDGEVREVRIG